MTKSSGGKGPKRRGDAYERELARHLSAKLGITIERAPLSGGGAIGQFHGGADLLGAPGLHIEAKRTNRLQLEKSLAQAETSIAKTNAPEVPIVISRPDRVPTGQSYAIMRLDDFIHLYAMALDHLGVRRNLPEPADPNQAELDLDP